MSLIDPNASDAQVVTTINKAQKDRKTSVPRLKNSSKKLSDKKHI